MAGALIENESDEKLLKDLGVKDSKLLTHKIRKELFHKITKLVKYKIIMLQPDDIDTAIRSHKLNLNWLEANTSAEIIDFLKPKRAIIDCPSPNIEAYHDYLKNIITTPAELILKHKAEAHPIVAAASILAKVTRDKEVNKLKDKIKIDFGSGYMTDELTVNFLKNHHQDYPELFRKTWASYKKVFQKDLSEF